MRFDRALPGVPVVASGVQGDELLAIVTRQGRVSRHGMRQVLTSGFQAVNCGREDRVTGVALAQDGRELLLVTADGYGRRLLAEWVPVSDRPNVKGKVMVARRSDVVAMDSLSAGETIWLATSSQLASVDFGHLPQENSTRSYGLLKLAKGETVRGCFKFTHADSQRS
jgi:DNA gyrase/topoisomerase IV subunit A